MLQFGNHSNNLNVDKIKRRSDLDQNKGKQSVLKRKT